MPTINKVVPVAAKRAKKILLNKTPILVVLQDRQDARWLPKWEVRPFQYANVSIKKIGDKVDYIFEYPIVAQVNSYPTNCDISLTEIIKPKCIDGPKTILTLIDRKDLEENISKGSIRIDSDHSYLVTEDNNFTPLLDTPKIDEMSSRYLPIFKNMVIWNQAIELDLQTQGKTSMDDMPETYVFKDVINTIASSSPPGSVLHRIETDKKLSTPNLEDDNILVEKDIWSDLVFNALQNIPTLITGPSGVGKTTVIEHLARKIGMNYEYVDMSTMTDPVSGLLGQLTLLDGASNFSLAPFASFCKKENTVVLCDEINRIDPNASNILFPILDDRRTVTIPIAYKATDKKFKVGKGTVFFGTANIGGKYSGTSNIDEALRERMYIIEFDYPKKEVELAIVKHVSKGSLSDPICNTIVNIIQEIRSLCLEKEYDYVPSIRATKVITTRVVGGFSVEKACKSYLMPRVPKELSEEFEIEIETLSQKS